MKNYKWSKESLFKDPFSDFLSMIQSFYFLEIQSATYLIEIDDT